MKIIIPISVSAILLLASPLLAGTESNGHVAYYLFDSDDTSYGVEAVHDFLYYYGQLEPWLKKAGVAYSFHEEQEFSITTSPGKKVSFTRKNFERRNDIGIILIRPDGDHKMIRGVWTDVDWAQEITSYFGIKSD